MPITTIGSREARMRWRDLLDTAYTGEMDTVIERNGKPVAVLIPYQDYLALEEALDDLRAARRIAKTYEALKRDPAQGQSYAELRGELKNKGLLDE